MSRSRFLSALYFCFLLLASCSSPEEYREDADREVSSILDSKQMAAFGDSEGFSIDWKPDTLQQFVKEDIPEGQEGEAVLKSWDGPLVLLLLEDALKLAMNNSRSYQTQKENVYLSALSLSLERHRWDFIFSGDMEGAYVVDNRELNMEGSAGLGVSKMLAFGGQVGLNLGANFFRYVTGDPDQSLISAVTASFTVPLLQGAGRAVATESLTQAERNMVYELRDFKRYRRQFTVSIASEYYRVLQQLDSLDNAERNREALEFARRRTEAFAKAGHLPEFEVDQARQNLLEAEQEVILAKQTYKSSLDSFKVTLGLQPDANVDLDPDELAKLADVDLEKIDLTPEKAIRIAFVRRMDFLNTIDQVEDAGRKIVLAEDGLLPELNLVGGASFDSQGPNNVANFRPRTGRYELGLDLELPLDRKEERNLYREALISFDRSRRSFGDERDNIMLQIRDAFRSLAQSRDSFEIQKQSVALAERRKKSTDLLLQKGDATTRDMLDSQSALLRAWNNRTRAVIDYKISRLELWRDMGILEIDDLGRWVEPTSLDLEE